MTKAPLQLVWPQPGQRTRAARGHAGEFQPRHHRTHTLSVLQLLKSGPPQSSPVLIMPPCHNQPAGCSNGVGQPGRAGSAGGGRLAQLLGCTAQAEEDVLPAGMPGQAVEVISAQRKQKAAAVSRETQLTWGVPCAARLRQEGVFPASLQGQA